MRRPTIPAFILVGGFNAFGLISIIYQEVTR